MSVFGSLYADHYDQLYSEKNYERECDLIENAVKRYARSPVVTLIDIGCGTGAHSIELASRGYQVTGIDQSQAMVDHASQKSASLDVGERPSWLCADARQFDTGRTFDLCIMMFAVIGYLTTNDDVLKALQNIRRHLRPGSLFVCDYWYGPAVLVTKPTDRIRVLSIENGQIIRTSNTALDVVSHTANVTFNLWALKGNLLMNNTTETHRLRYFFPQEFALLLSQAGFRLHSMSSFPELEDPLTEKTWNAFVVAEAS